MSKLLRQRWGLSRPPDVPFTINLPSWQAVQVIAWLPTLASHGTKTLRDLSGYNNNGTLFGDTYYLSDPNYGWALHFDGTGDYVECGTKSILDFGASTDFSVEVVCRFTVNADVQCIINKTEPTVEPWQGFVIQSRYTKIRFILRGAGALAQWDTAGAYNDGEWHHILLACDRSGDATVYIDGLYNSTQSISSVGSITCDEHLTLGKLSGYSSQYFNGDIAHATLWRNRILTSASAWQLHDQATRWELYKPQMRQWQVKAPAAPPPTAALPIFPPPDAIHSLVFGGVTVR